MEAFRGRQIFALSQVFCPFSRMCIDEALLKINPGAPQLEMPDTHVRDPFRRFRPFAVCQSLQEQSVAPACNGMKWSISLERAPANRHVGREREVGTLAAILQNILHSCVDRKSV